MYKNKHKNKEKKERNEETNNLTFIWDHQPILIITTLKQIGSHFPSALLIFPHFAVLNYFLNIYLFLIYLSFSSPISLLPFQILRNYSINFQQHKNRINGLDITKRKGKRKKGQDTETTHRKLKLTLTAMTTTPHHLPLHYKN